MFAQPFRFKPEFEGSVSGQAFSLSFRVLTVALVAGAAAWGLSLWHSGMLGTKTATGGLWLLSALVLMGITAFYILRSHTSLSAIHLRQSWIWDKEMQVAEFAYAKLIRVRGLEWLIAPRLYVRSQGGKFATFYGSTPEVLTQFEHLCRQLSAIRDEGR